MEGQLLWMLIVQLIVIFLVAISILIFMLKKLVGRTRIPSDGSKSILISAADTLLGTQIAQHLASLGFRVFAGVSDVNSKAAFRLRSSGSPWLHIIPLDVTKDDSLNLAVKAVREHLHAGERGLWAVIHLAGTGVKTSYVQGGDDELQLRTALELTVIGMVRLIRTCLPHLSAAKGRLIILGADDGMSLGLRAWGSGPTGVTHGVWTAARFAAEGLAAGLRAQLRPHGVDVVTLHPDAYYSQRINEIPLPINIEPEQKHEHPLKFVPANNIAETPARAKTLTMEGSFVEVLSPYALRAFEDAVLDANPEQTYVLTPSATTRIKSIFIAFSPTCVSNSIFKQHKLAHMQLEHAV